MSLLRTAPLTDRNDYASQGVYWWATTASGCPYELRDGQRNPEIDLYTDRKDSSNMVNSVYYLSLAWWYTDDARYRQKAGEVLRTWFINGATRMNPNLQHAQLIPCKCTGRKEGIIDFSQVYTDVLDAVALLNTKFDGAWSQQDANAFRTWNQQYLSWLTTSEFGQKELAAKNNHGTFALMQVIALQVFLGQTAAAKAQVIEQRSRIDQTIAIDGTTPLELKRATSWHYANFVLVAYLRTCAMAARLGIDLWGFHGAQGQSIGRAVDYLAPYAGGKAWPWPKTSAPLKLYAAYDIMQFGAERGLGDPKRALQTIPQPPGGSIWKLAPAVRQQDSTNVLGVFKSAHEAIIDDPTPAEEVASLEGEAPQEEIDALKAELPSDQIQLLDELTGGN